MSGRPLYSTCWEGYTEAGLRWLSRSSYSLAFERCTSWFGRIQGALGLRDVGLGLAHVESAGCRVGVYRKDLGYVDCRVGAVLGLALLQQEMCGRG